MTLAGAGIAFTQRQALEAWYLGARLERASDDQRGGWVDRLVALDEPAAPRLIACLQKENPSLCEAARSGLERLLSTWGPKDPRSARLAERLFEAHPNFSACGQIAALQMLPEILATGSEACSKARTIVASALKDRSPELRYLAIRVAACGEINMLPALVPLLDDADPRVRQMAMRALGPMPDENTAPAIETDQLIRWLHDPDPEVRRLCEMYLTNNRGRSSRDIRLGRLLTHPDTLKKLQLLMDLPDEEDLDLGPWLRRLSRDQESAVRAAAIRVAAENHVNFADRLDQMIKTDDDGAVRQLAEHYRRAFR
jgi:hypothetical protein